MTETIELSPPPVTVANRTLLFERLYETTFPLVAEFISKRNGKFQDARDIFQDALVIFYEKLRDGIELHINEEAYVLGIAKHLWFRRFNKEKNHMSFSNIEAAITIPDDYVPQIQTSKVLAVLEKTGKKCLDLLTAFYYHKQPLQHISNTLGFSSERSATVQKFKCMEKLRDSVKDKLMTYEDFTE